MTTAIMNVTANVLGRPNSTERDVTVLRIQLQPHATGFAEILRDSQGACGSRGVGCDAGGTSKHKVGQLMHDSCPEW